MPCFLVKTPYNSTVRTEQIYSTVPNLLSPHQNPTEETRNAGEAHDDIAASRCASLFDMVPTEYKSAVHDAPTGKPQRSPISITGEVHSGSPNSFSAGISLPSGESMSSFVITPHSTIYVNSDGITLTEEICSAFLAASVASSEKTSRNTSISPSSMAVREENIFDFIMYTPEIIIFQLQHNHYRNNICSGGSKIAEKKTV